MKTVAFVIFPDFQILDAAGPMAAFEMPMQMVRPQPLQIKVMAAEAGAVASSGGGVLVAEALSNAPIDTLVIAGGDGTLGAMRDTRLIAWLRQRDTDVRRICSVCSGSAILAAAGLLDGRIATTHWSRSREFEDYFPNVRLQPDRIWTQDGKYWTSAGITAGIDLSLALIEDDYGEAIARKAAEYLVVYYRRPGGQSQFSPLLDFARNGGRFGELAGWMRENLSLPLNVDQLAEQAAMSSRNFSRAFLAETGVTPAKAVERLRLDAARARLEGGSDPVSQIAEDTGFGDTERMRRAFVRVLGASPQTLRQIARGG